MKSNKITNKKIRNHHQFVCVYMCVRAWVCVGRTSWQISNRVGVSVKWCAYVKINSTQNNRSFCFPSRTHTHKMGIHSTIVVIQNDRMSKTKQKEKSFIWIAYHMIALKKKKKQYEQIATHCCWLSSQWFFFFIFRGKSYLMRLIFRDFFFAYVSSDLSFCLVFCSSQVFCKYSKFCCHLQHFASPIFKR